MTNRLHATFTTLRRSVPFSLRLQLAAWYTIAFAVLLLFTGAVFRQEIIDPSESQSFNFSIVNFSAGSRNKFHQHTSDQLLIVTEGTGVVATDHEERTVSAGDVVLIPAGEGFPSASQAGVAREGLDQVLSVRPDLEAGLKDLLASAAGQAPAELLSNLPIENPAAFGLGMTESSFIAGVCQLFVQTPIKGNGRDLGKANQRLVRVPLSKVGLNLRRLSPDRE